MLGKFGREFLGWSGIDSRDNWEGIMDTTEYFDYLEPLEELADRRRQNFEFSVGDQVLLKISPTKGVVIARR